MKPKTMTTLTKTNSIHRSPLRRGLLIIPLAFVCFALTPASQAVTPAPDGGYPGGNTAEGADALLSLTTGVDNTAIGRQALRSNTTPSDNTATGYQALRNNTSSMSASGDVNTAFGSQALFSNTTGDSNNATGYQALFNNTTGVWNEAYGYQALNHNKTGRENTAIGDSAGFDLTGSHNICIGSGGGDNLTTGDYNIDIGNFGNAGEATTIRIGDLTFQTATFIAGIAGVEEPLPEGGAIAAVTINSDGQLGIASPSISSRRFKKDIGPMDKASEAILALKPVTFHYKSDPKGIPQFGLVAEDVEKVNPDLITRDRDGKPYTVRYDAVNAMLLNEFLKAHRKIEEQEATIAQLKSGMNALAATVKEQAAQIQKVSAQLETSKPAPQTVVSNQ
jgi:hypothetical protein